MSHRAPTFLSQHAPQHSFHSQHIRKFLILPKSFQIFESHMHVKLLYKIYIALQLLKDEIQLKLLRLENYTKYSTFKICPVKMSKLHPTLIIFRCQLHTKRGVACVKPCLIRLVDNCKQLLSQLTPLSPITDSRDINDILQLHSLKC